MYFISVVFVVRGQDNKNQAQIRGFYGKSFEDCIQKMHKSKDEMRIAGTPVIQHTIIDIEFKE